MKKILLMFVVAAPCFATRTVFFAQSVRGCFTVSPTSAIVDVQIANDSTEPQEVTIEGQFLVNSATPFTGTDTIPAGGAKHFQFLTYAGSGCNNDFRVRGKVTVTNDSGFITAGASITVPIAHGGSMSEQSVPISINSGKPF